jgi:hypothetical protein
MSQVKRRASEAMRESICGTSDSMTVSKREAMSR